MFARFLGHGRVAFATLIVCFLLSNERAYAVVFTHWYKADGNALDSITGESGTLVGTTFAPGLTGQAFKFDGTDDYVDLQPGNLIGTGNQPFTTSMWINPAGTPTNFYYTLGVFTHDTQLLFTIEKNFVVNGEFISIQFRDFQQWWIPLNLDSLVGNWNLVTAEYDGGDKNLASSFSYYLNGNLLNGTEVNVGGTGAWPTNENQLGADHFPDNIAYYNGLMQNICIYNDALSSSQVQMIYNEGCSSVGMSSVPEPPTLWLLGPLLFFLYGIPASTRWLKHCSAPYF